MKKDKLELNIKASTLFLNTPLLHTQFNYILQHYFTFSIQVLAKIRDFILFYRGYNK
jgi:hypothetical protein